MEASLLQELHKILTQEYHNSYICSLLSSKEHISDYDLNHEEIEHEIHAIVWPDNGHHPGRYHLPTAPEVSILVLPSIPRHSE